MARYDYLSESKWHRDTWFSSGTIDGPLTLSEAKRRAAWEARTQGTRSMVVRLDEEGDVARVLGYIHPSGRWEHVTA